MKYFRKIDNKKFEYIILGIVFILVLIINFLTPLITDDFYYSMIGDKHISSLKDIFDFQVAHYFGWGGRTIAHTIAQLFLLYPKSALTYLIV